MSQRSASGITGLPNSTSNADTNFAGNGAIFEEISFIMSKYVFPVLVACGFFNNILIIIIMSQKKYKRIVSCFYLRSLSVFEIVNMVWFTQTHVHGVMAFGAYLLGDVFCVQFFALSYFATNASNWTTVLMTVTRLIAVLFPFKVGIWCTMNVARISMGSIVMFFAAVSIIQCTLWGKSSRDVPSYCFIALSVEHTNIMIRVYSALSQVIPCLLISIFNAGIFLKLNIRTVRKIEIRDQTSKNESAAMTLVLVASIVFLIFIIPYAILSFISNYQFIDTNLKTPFEKKLKNFYMIVTDVFYCSNSIFNLYIYCICCKKFRDDLVSLFDCLRKH